MVYCTLFDSNYLDKGIVLLNSINKVDRKPKVYVLCMDCKCISVLNDLMIPNTVLIDLVDIMDEKLAAYKSSRSRAEFCWTCTGVLIKYVITYYKEAICTYIDSDLYFYSDPSVLIDEMKYKNCTVQVVSHRFPQTIKGKFEERQSGKNCVQFNTFTNEPNSMKLLNKWIDQCYNECSINSMGDQKYTDDWGDYPFVNISSNGGAGVAPWNIYRYKLINKDDFLIYDRYEKKQYRLVFYHFQFLIYRDRYNVYVNPYAKYVHIDRNLYEELYFNYLIEIEKVKGMIEKRYSFVPLVTSNSFNPSNSKQGLKGKVMSITDYSFFENVDRIISKALRVIRRNKLFINVKSLM